MRKPILKLLNRVWNEEKRIPRLPHKLQDIRAVVFYGDGKSASHHAMWDEVVAGTGVPYLSIFTEGRKVPWRDEFAGALHLTSIEMLDGVFGRLPNLRVALYPSNNSKNTWLVRMNSITHVFIGHGDSDKPSSANRVFRLFDEVWTAGDAHINRFKKQKGDFSSIRFAKVGLPWLRNKLMSLSGDGDPSVVYLPTWRGYFKDTHFSSLPIAEEMFQLIERTLGASCPIRVKAHPWSRSSELRKLRKSAAKRANLKVLPVTDSIWNMKHGGPRFFLCDTSAIITECLFFDRPILEYIVPQSELYRKTYDWEKDFTYKFNNLEQFSEILKRFIVTGHDPQARHRKDHLNFRVDRNATLGNAFSRELRRLSGMDEADANQVEARMAAQ